MSRLPRRDLLDALFSEVRTRANARRKSPDWADKVQLLTGMLMAAQALLNRDMARRVAVRAARRCGKSTAVLLIVLLRCFETPGAKWRIIGLTRDSIRGIYWAALHVLNDEYELGLKFHEQRLEVILPNGSQIWFSGAEKLSEIEKIRGTFLDGIVVDECKSFAPHVFTELVHDVLEATLMDRDGQLILIGTPGDFLAGPFYLATAEEPIESGNPPNRQSNCPYGTTPRYPFVWSLHEWTLEDNTTVFTSRGKSYTLWDQALEIKERNGWADDHPTWRREYLGHWVANNAKRVYRYFPHLHDYDPQQGRQYGIPQDAPGGWLTAIGVDPGTRDGTGWVVWGWTPHRRDLWELHSERIQVRAPTKAERLRGEGRDTVDRMTVSTLARKYHELEAEYGPFSGSVGDMSGLATMVVDTLGDEHGVYIEPAEKREKNDHIDLFNDDLDRGFIHVRRGSQLSEDLLEGRWHPDKLAKGKREEDPAVPNDVSDAGIYSFRWCNHRRATPEPAYGPRPGSREYIQNAAAAELAALVERARQRGRESLDNPWWNA